MGSTRGRGGSAMWDVANGGEVHVYKTQNCTGGWTLQPLDDACSDVSAFDSIRVVLDA